jgi:uncharacterized protein YjbJ (UPF0337 family)
VSIADRTWDHLPAEIHSRVMAATAHAQVRQIEHHDVADTTLPEGVWTVDAVAGDRFVHQVLALRSDGSVAEETRTFLTTDVLDVSFDADGAAISVSGPSGPDSIHVPDVVGRALDHRDEEDLERAVKGVGQSIAGRLKEVAGELLDDPGLQQAGIAQQREGEIRRAQPDEPT